MALAKKPAAKKPANKPAETDREETKREKFVRLVNPRVNGALRKIAQIGKLGGSAYEKTDNDIAKIEDALNGAVKDCITRLRGAKQSASGFAIESE